jgi:hypothetical protein
MVWPTLPKQIITSMIWNLMNIQIIGAVDLDVEGSQRMWSGVDGRWKKILTGTGQRQLERKRRKALGLPNDKEKEYDDPALHL